MNTSKYSDFYLEICKYYGYEIKDDKFVKSEKSLDTLYFGRLRKVDFS